MRSTLFLATLCTLITGLLAPAQAGLLRINFTGEIESLTTAGVDGAATLETVFNIADPVTGTAIFDSAALLSSATGTRADYDSALQWISITIAGQTFSATGGATTVYNNDVTFDDAFKLDGLTGITGPMIGGLSADRVKFHLSGPTLSTIPDLALPDLSDLAALIADNVEGGDINFVSFDNDEVARFDLIDVSAEAVIPAPAAASLLLAGLALSAAVRRHR